MNLSTIVAALNTLGNLGCEQLPEDWQLNVTLSRGEMGFDLINPDGDVIETFDDDYEGADVAARMFVERVDYARSYDGLEPTGILEDE